MQRLAIASSTLCLVLHASAAFGDAIGPYPPCPQGQYLSSGAHAAPPCGAKRCTKHEDCPESQACAPYCNVTVSFFGGPAVPTGRCTSNKACAPAMCAPFYCEPGARTEFVPTDATSQPSASAPSTTNPAGTAKTAGTAAEPGKNAITEPAGGCSCSLPGARQSKDLRSLIGALGLLLGLGVAFAKRIRS
jgi:hypothetical protein